jgi:transcriptional regulator with XRE-family HTH domain
VSLSTVDRRGGESGFAHLLKSWRQKRRISQLDLALSSGVSQRHVSFLESGRANPSRSMILQLSETLEVPLRERNDWLTAAGFAPVFRSRPLDDPQMAQVMNAVKLMLTNHEPFPAIAVDRAWNIRQSNKPFDSLGVMMGGDIWTRIGGPERNLMRLFFHPNGIKPYISNWTSIAPLLWHRARREAEALAGEEMKLVLSDLSQYQDADTLWASPSSRHSARPKTSPPTNCASKASSPPTKPQTDSSAPPRRSNARLRASPRHEGAPRRNFKTYSAPRMKLSRG